MKNLILVAALILSGLFQLQADNVFRAAKLIALQNEKSIILYTANQSKGTEVLKIADAKGKIVFTDVIEKNKQRVKYVLNTLQKGNYEITLKESEVIAKYEITISDENVKIVDTSSYYRPYIHSENGKLLISAEIEKKEDIKVTIYDQNNELVFMYNLEKDKTFTQSFNLDQLPKGAYSVTVSTDYFFAQGNITL